LIYGRLLPVEALQLSHRSGSDWYPQDYVDPESSPEAEEISLVEKHYYDAAHLEKLFEEMTAVN